MNLNFQWKKAPKKRLGVLCGAEKSQEWLLPWWWSRYREHNAFPVTFFDFGMTDEMRSWCAERGELCSIELNSAFISPRNNIDPDLAKHWENLHGWRVWNSRRTWFKKPFAFLNSIYEKGIWIDLDCEVLGPLKSLFSHFDPASKLALARDFDCDHLPRLDPNVRYNGGVVVFQHGSSIIEKWAEGAVTQNDLFAADDSLLSRLIHVHQLDVTELPEIYNWRMARGLNLNAVIVHWVGTGGKAYIRKHGGLKPSLDAFHHSWKGKL
jgi:hypothetical protein